MKVALHLGKFDFFEKLATKASQAVPTSIFYTVKQHIDGGRLSFAQVEDWYDFPKGLRNHNMPSILTSEILTFSPNAVACSPC